MRVFFIAAWMKRPGIIPDALADRATGPTRPDQTALDAAYTDTTLDGLATTAGILMNTSGDLTSSRGNSGTAAASLTVNTPPPEAEPGAANPGMA
ncbi:hypothetical protein DWB85_17535 [Seongchinamella sediminis]|uniref:Uncharacterized protein n=1 Tax=Seongchinamella sediminis TaxID=2283635 RepID=A0A3L7DXD0_9GAMM|nr:hypothetical protein [Seongchinamella sediminis]RLQ20482.1 hypothetical protein DWB85_17535 [Seongchinamella sediminis]